MRTRAWKRFPVAVEIRSAGIVDVSANALPQVGVVSRAIPRNCSIFMTRSAREIATSDWFLLGASPLSLIKGVYRYGKRSRVAHHPVHSLHGWSIQRPVRISRRDPGRVREEAGPKALGRSRRNITYEDGNTDLPTVSRSKPRQVTLSLLRPLLLNPRIEGLGRFLVSLGTGLVSQLQFAGV